MILLLQTNTVNWKTQTKPPNQKANQQPKKKMKPLQRGFSSFLSSDVFDNETLYDEFSRWRSPLSSQGRK